MGGEFCVAAVFGSSRSWFANNPGLKREKGWYITKIGLAFKFKLTDLFSDFVITSEQMVLICRFCFLNSVTMAILGDVVGVLLVNRTIYKKF